MENSNLQQEVDFLLARQYIAGFNGKKYTDWAISLMQQGYQSMNLDILAGLDDNDRTSIERYFKQSTEDLQLNINKDKEQLLLNYTFVVARRVIDGRIKPQAGLAVMEEIRNQIYGYDFTKIDLIQFSYLANDANEMDDYIMSYNGLTKENLDEVIIEEMKMFLIAKSLPIENIRDLIYCNKCKCFSSTFYREGGLFTRRKRLCKKCHSKNFLAWNNVADRKQILQNKGIHKSHSEYK